MAYSKVFDEFWKCPERAKRSDEEKLMMIYLVTCPHRNMIGFYRLPLSYAAEDLGWEREKVLRTLRLINRSDFAAYDEKTNHVLVHKYLKYNSLSNPNMARGAVSKAAEMKESPLFITFFQDLTEHSDDGCCQILSDAVAEMIAKSANDPDKQPDHVQEQSAVEVVPVKPKKQKAKVMTDEEWMEFIRTSKAFETIDVAVELEKMKVWQTTHPNRELTRIFITRWLNKTVSDQRGVTIKSKPDVQGMTATGSKNMRVAQELIRQQQEKGENGTA